MPENETPTHISLDDAKKCPECSHHGNVVLSRPIMGGSLLTVQCENQVCPWYNTSWLIETNGMGEVQINQQAMQASKPHLAKVDKLADEYHKKVHEALARQIQEETRR